MPVAPGDPPPRAPGPPRPTTPTTQAGASAKEQRRTQREVGTTTNQVTSNGVLASGELLNLKPGEEGIVDWTPGGHGLYTAYSDVTVVGLSGDEGGKVWAELIQLGDKTYGKISSEQEPGGPTDMHVQPRGIVGAGVMSGVSVRWTSPTADPDIAREVVTTFVGTRFAN